MTNSNPSSELSYHVKKPEYCKALPKNERNFHLNQINFSQFPKNPILFLGLHSFFTILTLKSNEKSWSH